MVSFKVSQESHRRLRGVSKKFFTVAFFAALAWLAYTAVVEYRAASAIMADATVTDATVELDGISEERGRRGRVKEMYHFVYSFEAGGRTHQGRFDAAASNAGKYLEAETIKVAYSNADPGRFDRLDRLESQGSLGSWLKRMLVIIPIAALLAAVSHLLLTGKLIVPRPSDAEAQPAG